ncbi:hypothetical protein KDH_41110 [Dictyobacter sp. S3.2.2.5]|uniref:Thioesterase domain-containing protein n=1 Tax=Dictyobacter halimunensis TaxID=3026934 RepID=A0ABQ6FU22_9CHLR|nr:hypothetical protein KDH_41110 [Dictyobacter sp. S3.2.2.5]
MTVAIAVLVTLSWCPKYLRGTTGVQIGGPVLVSQTARMAVTKTYRPAGLSEKAVQLETDYLRPVTWAKKKPALVS